MTAQSIDDYCKCLCVHCFGYGLCDDLNLRGKCVTLSRVSFIGIDNIRKIFENNTDIDHIIKAINRRYNKLVKNNE